MVSRLFGLLLLFCYMEAVLRIAPETIFRLFRLFRRLAFGSPLFRALGCLGGLLSDRLCIYLSIYRIAKARAEKGGSLKTTLFRLFTIKYTYCTTYDT